MALFDVLPPDLFKPLASPTRRLSADLLLHLHTRTFGLAAEAPRRADVLREIGDFIQRWETINGPAAAEDGDPPASAIEDRARTVYQRLVATGWLIEHKDRYLRLVDIDPDAGGLLHVLSRIESGEARSYGGAVIGVLSALENAAANPAERSENVRNALSGARDFLAHMRTVSVSLRKVEERILNQQSLRDVFRHFFEDFVERHLIADFKTLHTKDNPFRFRSAIMRQAHSMSGDPLMVQALSEAYVREGRARDVTDGQRAVVADLYLIVEIFEGTERHLAAIDATASRIERRIANAARYMDRVGRKSENKLVETIRAVSAKGNADTEISVKTPLLPRAMPVGPSHIPSPRRERVPIGPSTVREEVRDPAMEAYGAAKAEYVRKTRVTPQVLLEFLDKTLGRKLSIRGSEIQIDRIEDFISFQRLREIRTIFDGSIARKYDIELLNERISNEWIVCQDFVIRRMKPLKESKNR